MNRNFIFFLATILFLLLIGTTAHAATNEILISRFARDHTTILNQTNVTYQWMESNLPVQGDGVTRYYHQGPCYCAPEDRWNPGENFNYYYDGVHVDCYSNPSNDMGILKGTNLKDLCDLVGGLSQGDEVSVVGSDFVGRSFGYKNVYQYTAREGPMVITWERDGLHPDSPGDNYASGMRLVWFADNSTNPLGLHVFGNWDWHEAAESRYWYYNNNNGELYPSSRGLSVHSIAYLNISSDLPAGKHMGVFRPSAFLNWILDHDVDGSVDARDHFGGSNDKPVVADFNNDLTPDRAVFRAGEWIIDFGMDGVIDYRPRWGMSGDIPLAGDMNADGIADRAVFRYGLWIIDYGMDGSADLRNNYGTAGDVPLTGDFNNDGIADRAVFRGSAHNNWIFDYGMDGVTDTRNRFGTAGDIPTVCDFNADGKTDRAVYRAGEWIIDYSMDASVDARVRFGASGDIPLSWNS